MKLSSLISPEYIEEQRRLHAAPKGYGGRGDKWAPVVAGIARRYGAASVLDYGCGQGTLKKALAELAPDLPVSEYDPAIKGKSRVSGPADLVVCSDVIEHIEPDRLGVVIDHLFRLANKALFAVIATRPSKKLLSDGRNAHLIIEPEGWWRERLVHPAFEHAEAPRSPLDQPSREWIALLVRK